MWTQSPPPLRDPPTSTLPPHKGQRNMIEPAFRSVTLNFSASPMQHFGYLVWTFAAQILRAHIQLRPGRITGSKMDYAQY